jgi:hypothetical protein
LTIKLSSSPVFVPPVKIQAPVVRAAFINPFLNICERHNKKSLSVDENLIKVFPRNITNNNA